MFLPDVSGKVGDVHLLVLPRTVHVGQVSPLDEVLVAAVPHGPPEYKIGLIKGTYFY